MTIAAGFKFDGGILFCADTKITAEMRSNETKIFPLVYGSRNECATLFVLAGSVPFARAAIEDCQDAVAKIDFTKASIESIGRTIKGTLVTFYRTHLYPHPDRKNYEFQLLIGIWFKGQTQVFSSVETVLNPVDDYECLGSGAYLSKYWIRKFLLVRWPPQPRTLDETGLIAAYALRAAIEYDEYCGGQAEFMIMKANGEFGSHVGAKLYPGDEFAERLHDAACRVLLGLTKVDISDKAETDSIMDKFMDEVRELNKSHHWWTVREALRKSMAEST